LSVTVAWARGLKGKSPVGEREIEAAVEAALEHGGESQMSISVAIVGDAEIARLHGRWFDDPTPTDVISFDLRGDGGDGPMGELYVSLECALRVARERGLDEAREVLLYAVHGALHLCGFDDVAPRDRAAMRRAEARVLSKLGIASAKSHVRTRHAARKKKMNSRRARASARGARP
jgi:probable rRNA maturation factor